MLPQIAWVMLAQLAASPFPERTPGLIEACISDAIENGQVSVTEDSHKYICGGQVAERFWVFLKDAKIKTYEQDVGADGHWLGREFPLGACFKRLRLADGTPTKTGLSCTVWIPRVSDPVDHEASPAKSGSR